MKSYLNFDKFMREKERDTIIVTIYGKQYEVCKEVPAIVPVLMARYEGTGDKVQQTKMMMKAADMMLGRKNVDELCTKGMSSRDFGELIQKLFVMCSDAVIEDEDAQELSDDSAMTATEAKNAGKK